MVYKKNDLYEPIHSLNPNVVCFVRGKRLSFYLLPLLLQMNTHLKEIGALHEPRVLQTALTHSNLIKKLLTFR